MISPTTFADQLLFTTVRIETVLDSGANVVGTGFFYEHKTDGGESIPLVVTNRHVIRGASKGILRLHEAKDAAPNPSGHSFNVEIDDFERKWYSHPDDEIDICVMHVNHIDQQVALTGRDYFYIQLDSTLIPATEHWRQMTAIEEIVMVGYPSGLWDDKNNLPIVRRGITASHPAFDFCGRHEIVVDVACFPGSSGSPVFLFNSGSYGGRDGGLVIGSRVLLLGVLYAGPSSIVNGKIMLQPIPVVYEADIQVNMMIHLGFALKADVITATAKAHESELMTQATD